MKSSRQAAAFYLSAAARRPGPSLRGHLCLAEPPDSPKILIQTRQGKIASIYCDQPAKILGVEAQDDPRLAVHQAMPLMISPQTSTKLVGGYGTCIDRVLAMAFDDPTMDDDLRKTLDAHEIVLGDKWADVE
jgi:hypothetical protein